MTDTRRVPGRVTIGIPTRNRSRFVVRAVQSALAQSYDDLEVLLSDNCSTDDTLQRIEEIDDARLVVLKQRQNDGMVANFNACLTAATGELFLMLSDDDLLAPNAIERLAAPFRESTNGLAPNTIGLTWSPCNIIDSDGNHLWESGGGPGTESPLELILGLFNGIRGPRFCGIMLRTEDAISAGGYDETRYGPLCDMGNWMTVALRYSVVACINEPVASYTMHAISETSLAALREWERAAKNINEDLARLLRAKGDARGERLLHIAGINNISNGVAAILLQQIGKPGKIRQSWREAVHLRRYLLTAHVIKRLFRDGWKLLRVRRRRNS